VIDPSFVAGSASPHMELMCGAFGVRVQRLWFHQKGQVPRVEFSARISYRPSGFTTPIRRRAVVPDQPKIQLFIAYASPSLSMACLAAA